MQSLTDAVISASAPFGTAVMWWLGQMGLLVKLGDTVLCIDYYASDSERRLFPPPIPGHQMGFVNAFLGTHDHLDHIDHGSWKLWARMTRATFVYPSLHTEKITQDGIPADRQIGMNEGETADIGSVRIHAIAAAHEFLAPDPVTKQYPCLQYIIEGNGVRIYHAGDTLRYECMLPKLKSFGHFDAALLPINGRDAERYRRNCIGNMTYQEAADLAGELRPSLVLPGHWDMFADNSADPNLFADYLDAKYGDEIACLIPEHLVTIRITANA